MTQVFGDFIENSSPSTEYLIIGFSPSSIPLKQRWQNNGLSAGFIADYLVAFFPVDENEPGALDKRNKTIGAVKYITNELLENAMKFSDEILQFPVSIKLELRTDCLIFKTTNAINYQAVPSFQALIEELTTSDPSELFIRRLEKNTEDNWNTSGLGLITIINDYRAKLGWKFEIIKQQPEMITVTTTVQLPL
ncbi:MAG: ATP-binding protein [Nostoc sp. NMS1]|nr:MULTISPECIES: ATP-binding protein [unclassified Nostoc]MBN3907923.1 ATP-binding protein [Nostoc sp. NMS1]MBN3994047.1 ATP-binding protein [Nostoc sp. NMS2]